MYSLGLNIGHVATAALAKDGKVLACVSEERFTKIKNHWGMPDNAINWLLHEYNIGINRIDKVVVPSCNVRGFLFIKDLLNKKIDPRFRAVPELNWWTRLKYNSPMVSNLTISTVGAYQRINGKKLIEKDRKLLAKHLKITENKVIFIDHHEAHALTCAYNADQSKKWLIFTLDGEGGTICSSVNIWDGKKLRKLASTPYYKSIGKFYEGITTYLGMKSFEHEYKVMGLAPYAKEKYAKETYEILKKIIWLDPKNPLVFDSKFPTYLTELFLKDKMSRYRFDNIAAGAQLLVEELLTEWVKYAVKKYKISNVALAGGVFMNVKANKKIMELTEVKDMFVFPSCGDESLAISAAQKGYEIYCEENKQKHVVTPIKELYLGPSYSNEIIEKYLTKKGYNKKYIMEWHPDINKKIAELLAKNIIVARCTNRMEFGARALGNRSILCNPSNYDNIRILNELVKDRDFWMPFTPSMLKEREEEYIINPKKIAAPYMILTFDTTPKAQKDIVAAVHPYDFTARPQIVEREWNPDYYEILKCFENITGTGGVLNTSFNLHGLPIAMTPADAMHVFENSSLKCLAMGNWMVRKKETKQ